MEDSKFKYFKSNMFECFNAFKECIGKGTDIVYEKYDYRTFYWLNSYCNWMQLEPVVHEAIIVLVKRGDPDITDKWHEKMNHMPVMRIKVVPTSIATCSIGPGIASFDHMQIIYHNGVDLHNYDKNIEEWKERVFDHETHRVKADCTDLSVDARPNFGKLIYKFDYSDKDPYETEETIYNRICDGSIFKKLVEMSNTNILKVLKEDPLG